MTYILQLEFYITQLTVNSAVRDEHVQALFNITEDECYTNLIASKHEIQRFACRITHWPQLGKGWSSCGKPSLIRASAFAQASHDPQESSTASFSTTSSSTTSESGSEKISDKSSGSVEIRE